jgi:hypothetical protein
MLYIKITLDGYKCILFIRNQYSTDIVGIIMLTAFWSSMRQRGL